MSPRDTLEMILANENKRDRVIEALERVTEKCHVGGPSGTSTAMYVLREVLAELRALRGDGKPFTAENLAKLEGDATPMAVPGKRGNK